MFAGCVNDVADDNISRPDETAISQTSSYEAFVQNIQNENLSEHGIDVVAMLSGEVPLTQFQEITDVYKIGYTLEWCNLSQRKTDDRNDLIILIKAVEQANKYYDRTRIMAFVKNANGQMTSVYTEDNEEAAYKVLDVTGDGREEIILTAKNGRQGGAKETLQILSWRENQGDLAVIFDEILFSSFFLPYRCISSYQLQPAQNGGYDIVFDSWISRGREIFESGSSRFGFNGEKYVVKGSRYDYLTRYENVMHWVNEYAPSR
jgi:hypothetical protein